MVVSVIGLGYIGLPTAVMFASHNVPVIGVDVNQSTVDMINRGQIHIVEPGLEEVVKNAVHSGFLRATTQPEPADAFLVAVPTPLKGSGHDPDLKYVQQAAQSLASVLAPGNIVILESTCPVGATEQMANWLAEIRPDLKFPQTHGDEANIRIAYCPERVLPGKVLEELITNDRIIGGMTQQCSDQAQALYKTFVTGNCVIASSPGIAEMAKLTENSFRDVNIAFANELSVLCDHLSLDVWELIRLSNLHPRVNILQPGPGVGGHCIAVDPWFIVSSAPELARLIKTARIVNDDKPDWVIGKVHGAVGKFLQQNPEKTIYDVTIICYGVAFKPDIDDLRESPSLSIAQQLQRDHPGKVHIVEPNVPQAPQGTEDACWVSDLNQIPAGDIHVMLVDHSPFKGMVRPNGAVIDTRNVFQV